MSHWVAPVSPAPAVVDSVWGVGSRQHQTPGNSKAREILGALTPSPPGTAPAPTESLSALRPLPATATISATPATPATPTPVPRPKRTTEKLAQQISASLQSMQSTSSAASTTSTMDHLRYYESLNSLRQDPEYI